METTEQTTIAMSRWGADHWSTLAYLETRAVDHGGRISRQRMRCNPKLHPGLAHSTWEKEYPTRLRGGELQHDHDDWSCVDDFEAHGFIVVEGTGMYPLIRFTAAGLHLATQLRAHRANGGNWGDFQPEGVIGGG